MYKKIFIILVVCLLIVGTYGIYKWVNNDSKTKSSEYKPLEVKKDPFGQGKRLTEVYESDMRAYIHCMSHQKVKAKEKWCFYRITPERIQWLLEALDKNHYEHENIYRDILTRWKKGDFSRVDKDHNEIWKLQGGEGLGKATGILTPKEEQEFIKKWEH
jgi:hypothetical protein